MATALRNFIGGEWVESSATSHHEVVNPATGEVLGQTPLSGAGEVEQAVAAAQDAFIAWRRVPPAARARYLFKLRALMEERFEDLAATVTRENGKTLDESRGSVRRGIENVEHACGIPTLMMGQALEDIAAGIDCEFVRQPIGVCAAITPFNFPAMVPLWFWPYAIATGNTFILKPSEQVPLSAALLTELAAEAGIPPGVLNLVHGGKDAVNALLEHPGIAAISFVGSSPVAKHVYTTAAATGKRVQALGGAKNHIVIMPDADMDRAVANITESIFGCAGQRCLAGSVMLAPGKAYEPFRDKLLASAKGLTMGYGLDDGVTLGPVVSNRAKERVVAMIDSGQSDGAELLRGTDGVRWCRAIHADRARGDLRAGSIGDSRRRPRRCYPESARFRIRQCYIDLYYQRPVGTRVPLQRRRQHDRRQHRRGGTDGVLPVRRNEGVVLWRSQGSWERFGAVLHGQEGGDFEVVSVGSRSPRLNQTF